MASPVEANAARCRLLRADGTEWRVTCLYHAEEGLEVDAIQFGMPSTAEASRMNVPSLRRLEAEPLSHGDLLQWIGDEGDVMWSMTAPVRPLRA